MKLGPTVVRFAPSPTGYIHIGALRTALFDYLFAKKTGGKFILRIEDTDQERFVEDAEASINESLNWVGITPDESPTLGGPNAPYRQTERQATGLYQKYADQLVEQGKAYRDGDSPAIRFAMTGDGQVRYQDLIRGEIVFDNKLQEDFIIIKSDGFPTYNFANVIDDHEMKITHVLRGEEFISSTPKHIALYEALGWTPPLIAHLPVILGSDKKKLSKRTGDTNVLDYLQKGYLREAMINFMALLGWHPSDNREIFTLEELTREFELERVQSSPAIFDLAKLNSLNQKWLALLPIEQLYQQARDFGLAGLEKAIACELLTLIRTRITTLSDIPALGYFLLAEPFAAELDALKLNKSESRIALALTQESWQKTKPAMDAESLGGWAKDILLPTVTAKLPEWGTKELFSLMRVVILGKPVSPPLFESMVLLGRETVTSRLSDALKRI